MREPVTVVIAEVDSFVASVAARALRGAGFVVRIGSDAASARRLVTGAPPELVLVVDRTFCDPTTSLCEAAREGRRAHVIALVAGGRPRDVAEAIEHGADDCMTKPFSPRELVARVQWAARMLSALPPLASGLRQVLARAAAGASGEVCVSQGDTVGRIWFEKGRIAWATLGGRGVSLRSILEGTTSLEPDALNEVMAEAKRTNRNVLEVLVEWELVSRDDVAFAVQRYLREAVRAMLLLVEPAVAFAPAIRPGTWTGPTFGPAEILPKETHRNLVLPLARPSASDPPKRTGCDFAQSCNACALAARKLDGDLRLSGAESIALVHGPTGETLSAVGAPLDADVVRSKVRVMTSLEECDRAEELVVTAGAKYYVMAATSCPDAYVVLVAGRKKVGLGALKLESSRIAAQIAPDEAAITERMERSRRSTVPVDTLDADDARQRR